MPFTFHNVEGNASNWLWGHLIFARPRKGYPGCI